MRRSRISTVAALALVPIPALAQETAATNPTVIQAERIMKNDRYLQIAEQTNAANPERQEVYCVAIGKLWLGGNKDIQDIEKTPVPDSYKEKAQQDGCAGWSFIRESLIYWHYRYGSEHSMAMALDYFEANERHITTRTPNFRKALTEALSAIGHGSLPSGISPDAKIHHLQVLIDEWQDAIHWGSMRLLAAEFFNSQLQMDRAQEDISRSLAGYRVLTLAGADADGDATAEPRGDLIDRLRIERDSFSSIPFMETRMAILKARLSYKPTDISRASDLVDRGYQRTYSAALDLAERNDDFLCKRDPDAGVNDPEFDEIKESCSNDGGNFQWKVRRFWNERAEVDLLMASDPAHFALVKGGTEREGSCYAPVGKGAALTGGQPSRFNAFDRVEAAIRLAAHNDLNADQTLANKAFPPFTIDSDDQIDLSLRAAEARLKLGDGLKTGRISQDANIPAESGSLPANSNREAGEQWSEGMEQLVPASLLILPTEYPSRFRQIAGLYQTLFENAAKLGDETPNSFARETRAADYFRETLEHLGGATTTDASKR